DCHFDKAGPFLYDHDVVMVDGCASCHEVHGSPNRHLLKHEPQVNLCYQCHSASVTPGWHSAPRFLNEKCTACHTAIHGSNTNPFFLEE
ncbi:MAG: cytochrome C, partial [Gemmatimonadales bacterium]|nr:cytochrome C [Gemmatimonadales bacterium]